MSNNVHNPDHYMASLRPLVAQGRKRIAFLIGAGAPADVHLPGDSEPLIPAVAGLTKKVIHALDSEYGTVLKALAGEMPEVNIETLLSRIRSLGAVIGQNKVFGHNAEDYIKISESICKEIGTIVDRRLPTGETPYSDLVSWISGTSRDRPIEIFTTNYDLLFEEAFERARIPFFDGFSGAREPFFDPSTVASDDLPPRWTRVWKLHGSLGWTSNSDGEVIRTGGAQSTHLVFPEHLKYDRTQKAPYSALFDRLRTFLRTPDTLLITSGFSFADAHISAVLEECLSANPSSHVIAFQFGPYSSTSHAASIASRRGNMSVYYPDKAVINGILAPWKTGDPPTRDWESIRSSYWRDGGNGQYRFTLGSFGQLARFFASSRSTQGAQQLNNVVPFPTTQPSGLPGEILAMAAAGTEE